VLLLRPLRLMAQSLTEESSPRQLALGCALGMMIGLVPKGNLTAVILMTLLCAMRVNLAAGMAAAFFCSWFGLLLDPLAHLLGHWVLTTGLFVPIWTLLYDLPVIPWTSFNNTIVMGNLLLALLLFYPVYRFGKPQIERYEPLFTARVKKLRFVQLLWGVELAHNGGEA